MLKKMRIALAIACFIVISLLFLDISGVLHKNFAFLAEFQFIPALLALNVVVLVVLAVLTMVFGRIYCSVICPTGVYQDIVSYFARRIKSKKTRRYSFSAAKTVTSQSVTKIRIAWMPPLLCWVLASRKRHCLPATQAKASPRMKKFGWRLFPKMC